MYFDTTRAANGRRMGGGDIVTNEAYENFHLKLEWKIAPAGNSGIFFLVNEDKTKYHSVWETGIEMQILDDAGHAEGKINTHRAGDIFDLIPVSKITVKPAGEWNLAEIKLLNGKLECFLNNELVTFFFDGQVVQKGHTI